MVLALPIILIHGYAEDAHVWDSWVKWFKADHINAIPITYKHDDRCGTVAEHAAELRNMIADTHSATVNIVAHSKGGLDARWYIAHVVTDNVANLIMLGTPNQGTQAAYIDLTTCSFTGSAGLGDLQPESSATQSANRAQTHYYSIAGNSSAPCFLVIDRPVCYVYPNDGLVTVTSAKSTYSFLGVFPYNHSGLVAHKDVYEKVLPIIR